MEQTLEIGLQMIANSVTDQTLTAMLKRWKKEFDAHRARTEKPQFVLKAIGEGYDTLSEIAHFTGYPLTTVRRVTNRLVTTKKLSKHLIKKLNTTELKFELMVNGE